MSFIGEFIIDFIGEALASSPTLQRVCLWILFSISILLMLVPVMTVNTRGASYPSRSCCFRS